MQKGLLSYSEADCIYKLFSQEGILSSSPPRGVNLKDARIKTLTVNYLNNMVQGRCFLRKSLRGISEKGISI
jgi:hypothetical protein